MIILLFSMFIYGARRARALSFWHALLKRLLTWSSIPLSVLPPIPHFRPFSAILPLWQPKKPKFWKTEKNTWRYHHFTHHDNMLYCSLDMVRIRYNCYFSLWAIFCPFTPLTARKIKILKKWKKTPGDIIILPLCTTNDNISCMIAHAWTDGRTDGWMEKVTYRGGCPS